MIVLELLEFCEGLTIAGEIDLGGRSVDGRRSVAVGDDSHPIGCRDGPAEDRSRTSLWRNAREEDTRRCALAWFFAVLGQQHFGGIFVDHHVFVLVKGALVIRLVEIVIR